jgi:MATE family multidrug resistance protein
MPELLVGLFTADPVVIRIGAGLFVVAAVFQLFDGIQAVTTGALRGLGNTRTPMLVNLVGHWLIGLPLAYVMCFHYGWEAQGLWIGLATGLILIGATLLAVWHRESRSLTAPAG